MIAEQQPMDRHPKTESAAPQLQCVGCRRPLGQVTGAPLECAGCGRAYPLLDDLLIAQGELSGKNRIAAEFYNGEHWQKFRPLEQLFLQLNGGLPGSRIQILRHLRHLRSGSLLEVGIGDGENVALLPRGLRITGIDIAHRPLAACRDRHGHRGLLLALAEGERIPFADRSFDGVLCVGGFNFFSDPAGALSEMARVTRPGGRIVVADEIPNLREWGLGHLFGVPSVDGWMMRKFWFGAEFTNMVQTNRLDVAAVARSALGAHRIYKIWRTLGYCIVGSPP